MSQHQHTELNQHWTDFSCNAFCSAPYSWTEIV